MNFDKLNIIDVMDTLKERKNEREKEKANNKKMEKEKAKKEKEILEKALNSLCKPSASRGNMNNKSNEEDINDKKKDSLRSNINNNNIIIMEMIKEMKG